MASRPAAELEMTVTTEQILATRSLATVLPRFNDPWSRMRTAQQNPPTRAEGSTVMRSLQSVKAARPNYGCATVFVNETYN
jgi:hypothetical protein